MVCIFYLSPRIHVQSDLFWRSCGRCVILEFLASSDVAYSIHDFLLALLVLFTNILEGSECTICLFVVFLVLLRISWIFLCLRFFIGQILSLVALAFLAVDKIKYFIQHITCFVWGWLLILILSEAAVL